MVTRWEVRANGLRFALEVVGPDNGPLALCLHGFPDHPGTFRHLLPRLAEAGFRAVAPWLRGYPPTQLPDDPRIDLDTVTADVNALHRALGGTSQAVLIGHDWGAVVAARAASAAPDRWRRLVTLAVPPEAALRHALRDPGQVQRSAYLVDAALPGSATRFGYERLVGLWRTWSPGYQPTAADLDPLKVLAADRATRVAMLAWYRGFVRAVLAGRALSSRVRLPPQPHLLLHGRDDGCIDAGYARRAATMLPNPGSHVEIVPGAGHWLHLERPGPVGRLVLEHLGPAAGRVG